MERSYVLQKERREYPDPDGRTLVISTAVLPEFAPSCAFAERANGFYAGIRAGFDAFCAKKLLGRAKKEAEKQRPFGAVMTARVTFESAEYVSVVLDARVFDGEKSGNTARVSQVWNASDGTLESADAFVPPRARTAVTDMICAAVAEKTATGEAFFRRDARKRAYFDFSPRRFYLVPDGVAFYYDAGVLSVSPFPQVFTIKNSELRK